MPEEKMFVNLQYSRVSIQFVTVVYSLEVVPVYRYALPPALAFVPM